jgi:uncharacterized phage protein gp47/JayE
MGQWTDTGFIAKDAAFYKEQLQAVFQNAYGSDFNVTDETLPQNIVIQEIAELFANADADSIEVLAQLNPNTCSGIWLDLVGIIRGLPRDMGHSQKATVLITSTGSGVPFSIPQGQEFTVYETGEIFVAESLSQVSSTSASVTLTFASSGNSGTQIGYHMNTTGLNAITSIEVTGLIAGSDKETDLEYRTRLNNSASVASGTLQFVMNQISLVQGVRSVGVEYNDLPTEEGGIPPYCTEFIVMPSTGVDEAALPQWKYDVATAILWNKVPGAPTHGNTTVTNVVDPFGADKDVKFTIPNAINLEIEVSISTREEQPYLDMSQVGTITHNIAEYINNLGTGVDVSMSRIFQIILNNANFDISSLRMRQVGSGSWVSNANYPIDVRECAVIDEDNIRIGA